MASRVGGGGYAENRGGFGDRTGGGMSGNARDGLGGNGKGGDHNFAADRARMRALGATTITPKYGWDQAQLSDFGITGGLMNAFKGVLAGNTYDGRMPQGLQGGYGHDGVNRALQVVGMGYGQPLTLMQRAGMYQGGANGQPNRVFTPQMFQPQPQAAPSPAAPMFGKGFMPGKALATGGQYGVSTFRPGYDFLRPPHS